MILPECNSKSKILNADYRFYWKFSPPRWSSTIKTSSHRNLTLSSRRQCRATTKSNPFLTTKSRRQLRQHLEHFKGGGGAYALVRMHFYVECRTHPHKRLPKIACICSRLLRPRHHSSPSMRTAIISNHNVIKITNDQADCKITKSTIVERKKMKKLNEKKKSQVSTHIAERV